MTKFETAIAYIKSHALLAASVGSFAAGFIVRGFL